MPKLKKEIISIKSISKIYHLGNNVVKALDDVSISIYENDFISIMGPSGSGKSTLFPDGYEADKYPDLYKNGQLNKARSVDMLDELNKQIGLYKKHGKSKFVFVEIGNYLGESLDLWGDILEKKLDNNFLIISIDPFTAYVSESDKNWRPDKSKAPIKSGAASKMSKVIEKIYMYFIHNPIITQSINKNKEN